MGQITPVQVLENAREFLKTHKWGRGGYYTVDGSYCAVGALYAGNLGEKYWIGQYDKDTLDQNREALLKAHNYLNIAVGYERNGWDTSITGFNDRVAKEKRDVIRKFGKAIQIAKRATSK